MQKGYRLQSRKMAQKEIITLIEDALIEWRTRQTRARDNVSLNRFADYLGVSRSLVSMWLLGKRPVTSEHRQKIAEPISDLVGAHAYEILDVTPPDPFLKSINARWSRIPPEKQHQLAKDAEKYEAEALKNDGSKNSHKPRKTASH